MARGVAPEERTVLRRVLLRTPQGGGREPEGPPSAPRGRAADMPGVPEGLWQRFLSATCCARASNRPRVGRKGAFGLFSQGDDPISPGLLVEVVLARHVPDLDAPQSGEVDTTRLARKSVVGELKRPWLVDRDRRSDVYVSVAVLRAADATVLAGVQEVASFTSSAEEMVASCNGSLGTVSEVENTPMIWNSQNPVFHSWLHFPGVDASSELLLLDCRLMDYDEYTRSDPIGQAMVAVSDLRESEDTVCRVTLVPGVAPLLGNASHGPLARNDGEGLEPVPCELVLRCLRAWPERKRVYLLRHGQSGWNKAQHEMDISGLAGFDHPLSKEGIAQSRAFNEAWSKPTEAWSKPTEDGSDAARWQQDFRQVTSVFSSPLTRAVQTCLLALRGHPALGAGPVRLLECAREVNSVGGVDSVGMAVGQAIEARVRKELADAIGEAETAQTMSPICPYSCSTGEWWSRAGTSESKQEIRTRITHLLSALVAAPGDACALVGHSLLFCELFRERCSADLASRRPEAVERLSGAKLGNAACCRAEVALNPDTGAFEIVDVSLMFGSCFEDGLGLGEEEAPAPPESGSGSAPDVPGKGGHCKKGLAEVAREAAEVRGRRSSYLEEAEDGMQRL
ncbi:unnamed protein product [Prorocentrum cordatum]|uniref:C2 domain-containing protein n=1 Tax=Prorocentrum cordatum TaxID=2364126 RepID=A0ABN9W2Z3_9DINO|nr:unnamed protein product [Polarella glacialis]